MKNKIFMCILSVLLVISMVGCSNSDDSSSSDAASSSDTSSSSDAAESDSETESQEEADASDAAEDTEAAGDAYNISVILKNTSEEYWRYVQSGAVAYGEEHPEITVSVKGATSETAFDEQQNMIETDLNNGDIDAYVIAPLQPDTVATLIKGEEKPVVALDSKIEAPEICTFVGTGNEAAAKLGGEAAVEYALEQGWALEDITCIYIAGVQGDSTNIQRMNGFKEGIEAAGATFAEDEILYSNSEASQAVTCMEAIMQNHPEGVAIIAGINDAAVVAAARSAKSNAAYDKTVFIGFDGILSACESILDGEETITVAQNAYKMGYSAVEAAVKKLQGETLEDFIDTGATIVTLDNVEEHIQELKGYIED